MKTKDQVKEKPMIFTGESVRAIQKGIKHQTRRIIKLADGSLPKDEDISYNENGTVGYVMDFSKDYPRWRECKCPYPVGTRIWVRETWVPAVGENWYRADGELKTKNGKPIGWKRSIFMPRRASRINLLVTKVRVERVRDITTDDAKAEGISKKSIDSKPLVAYFKDLWNTINEKRGYGWDVNPWVFVYDFEVEK